jgi:hypothetical protein
VLAALQRDVDLSGKLDWETHYVDGTIVRAHQHAAGAVGQADEALGRSRGGFSTKVHLRAEGRGKPMVVVLSGGERRESRYVAALLAGGRVRRLGRGCPRAVRASSSRIRATAIRRCVAYSPGAASGPSSRAAVTSGPMTDATRWNDAWRTESGIGWSAW